MTRKNPGPLLSIVYRDPEEGFEGYLVIDTLVDGVAGGGLRVTKSVDLNEVTNLARAMTLKNHIMGLPLGGAKSGVCYDPASPNLEAALSRFMKHVGPISAKMYGWGPDMNTPPDLCDAVAKNAGLKSRHMALAENSSYGYQGVENYNKALRMMTGPIPMTEGRTAIGVVAGMQTAAEVYGLDGPLRVAIQGFGSVGAGAAYFLEQRGYKVVGVADAKGYYRNADGLKFSDLYEARPNGREIEPDLLPADVECLANSAIFDEECDVMILAAVANAIDVKRAETVKTKMIVQGGNLVVAPEAEGLLHKRGIISVPDVLVNGGGIGIVGGVIQLGWDIDPDTILREISERVNKWVRDASTKAKAENTSVRVAAMQLLPESMRG